MAWYSAFNQKRGREERTIMIRLCSSWSRLFVVVVFLLLLPVDDDDKKKKK